MLSRCYHIVMFWHKAVNYARYGWNRYVHADDTIAPLTHVTGEPPDCSLMKIFGCDCVHLKPESTEQRMKIDGEVQTKFHDKRPCERKVMIENVKNYALTCASGPRCQAWRAVV